MCASPSGPPQGKCEMSFSAIMPVAVTNKSLGIALSILDLQKKNSSP